MKILRPSVIASREWGKQEERNQAEWKRNRLPALQRDGYTCVYCTLACQKFMQVNHIGNEGDHSLENLETICPACHAVQHLGINAMRGVLTAFECRPEVTNMAAIVCATRSLVAKQTAWEEIERLVLEKFGRPGGKVYDDIQTVGIANKLLKAIPEGEYRAYLPSGIAMMFHQDEEWNGYPESVWKWQCLPGSRYRK